MDERGGGGGLISPKAVPRRPIPTVTSARKVQTVGVYGARQTNASGQSKPTARSEPKREHITQISIRMPDYRKEQSRLKPLALHR